MLRLTKLLALTISVMVILACLPSAPAHAQQQLILHQRVPGPVAAIVTDGTYAVWRARQDATAQIATLYAARLGGGEPLQLAAGVPYGTEPALDNGVAAWYEQRDGGIIVRARDLATGEDFAAEPGLAISGQVRVQNRRVVWVEQQESRSVVRALLLDSGHSVMVGDGASIVGGPFVSGDWVAWASSDGTTKTLWRSNLRTMTGPQWVAQVAYDSAFIYALSDTQIVWKDTVVRIAGRDLRPLLYRVYRLDFSTWTLSVIQDGTQPNNNEDLFTPVVARGNVLVYQRGYAGTIIRRVLSTGAEQTIPAPSLSSPAATDGRYLVLQQADPWKLLGYDLNTGVLFEIDAAADTDILPSVAHGVVAWQRGAGDEIELFAAELGQLLPSAQRAFFPETNHTVVGAFLSYWQQNGSLAIFGYPLSDEQIEASADGESYVVQYFERQRFEYHPEHFGTPYVVQLGLLGARDAALRNLARTGAFEPVAAAGGADCAYFAETRHNVCGPFLRYWQTHGLEFGDAGLSYREALALFGYPLSETFTDPELGLSVQYFERARFEYHPMNSEPYTVLLGRLGADLLAP